MTETELVDPFVGDQAQIETLQDKAETLLDEVDVLQDQILTQQIAMRENVLAYVVKTMKAYGVTLLDVAESIGADARTIEAARKAEQKLPMRKPGKKAERKYRNPDNPEQDWSGRGREPAWIKGQDRTRFLIKR